MGRPNTASEVADARICQRNPLKFLAIVFVLCGLFRILSHPVGLPFWVVPSAENTKDAAVAHVVLMQFRAGTSGIVIEEVCVPSPIFDTAGKPLGDVVLMVPCRHACG